MSSRCNLLGVTMWDDCWTRYVNKAMDLPCDLKNTYKITFEVPINGSNN